MSAATSPLAPDGPHADLPRPDTDSVRASHAEREETVAVLHRALGAGRLDLDETDARVAAAYAARFRADLPPLLADLPEGTTDPAFPGSGSSPTWSQLWESLVWRLRVLLVGPGASAPTSAH